MPNQTSHLSQHRRHGATGTACIQWRQRWPHGAHQSTHVVAPEAVPNNGVRLAI